MHDMVTEMLPAWLRKAPRSSADPRAAARGLRKLIEDHSDEAERTALISENVIRGLADSGLFGLLVTKDLGGMETDPQTYIDVIEELSYADSSVGWVMMATTYCIAGAATSLGPTAIDAMYNSDAGYIACGHIAPLGKAEKVDGGYRISGTQQFGSGSQVSSWFLGCFVLHKDGKPDLSPQGKPQTIWAYAPRSKVRLKGNWDVMGLKATASYDFEFIDQVVAEDYVMAFPPLRPRRGGPMYEIPVTIGHVTWALGVGLRIMDEIKDLAKSKRRQNRQTLIDQTTFQRDFADALGTLEAARALVRSTFASWYDAAKQGTPPIEVRAHGRLAGYWATKAIADVGRFAQLAAGSDGVRNRANNRIQRCFRDLTVGATHRHVDHNVAIDAATVFLGINSPTVEI